MNVNKVILVGRLTRDPEIRNTPSGQTVASISIATNRFWSDKGGQKQEQTEFHNIVIWGRLAEVAGQYLTKGQEAYFEGRLQTRSYTAKDGSEKRVTEVIAENMQMGSRAGGGNAGGNNNGGGFSRNNSNSNSGYQNRNNQPVANTNHPPAPSQRKEEEIPTINLDDESEDIKLEDVPF